MSVANISAQFVEMAESGSGLGPDQTIPLVESMANRLTECLAAGGGHTHN